MIVLGRPAIVQRELGPEWRVAYEAPGVLALVHGADVAVTLSDDRRAVVLGCLNWNAGAVQDSKRTFGLSDLVTKAWGRYVAIENRDVSWRVFRDPSGRVPCFSARIGTQWVIFSHIEDAIAVGWKSDGPNWQVVSAFVQDGRIRDGRTGLAGVGEVLPGEVIGADGSKRLLWSPAAFTGDVVEDRVVARELLRSAVERSVHSVTGAGKVLHLLSGGLDSSIVLACLRQRMSPDQLSCLTFTQGDASELDELRFAKAAARAANVELITAHFAPTEVRLERVVDQINQPRPLGYVFSIENDDAELQLAQTLRPGICTSGAGGDGLFFQLRARTYCADFLLAHGPSPGALRVALDNARLSRMSMWTSLKEGWRMAYGGAEFRPEAAPRNPYLTLEAGDPAGGWLDTHPWFIGAEGLSPGKRLHLWAVLDCLNLFYPYRRSSLAETELPLVSQPVIETVLRIPSYVLSDGGRDRSLVREAFADIVPAAIIARTGKGAMDGYYAEVCAANASYLRDRLIDGVLVKQGIARRDEIERDLPMRGDPRDGREVALLQLLAVEVWASAWVGRPAMADA